MTTAPAAPNWGIKDEIAAYWTRRSATFDDDVGHRIPDGPAAAAWQALLREGLGTSTAAACSTSAAARARSRGCCARSARASRAST